MPAWHLPAGILNSFWCEFFPRLVAIAWHDGAGCTPPYLSAIGDPPPLKRGMGAAGVLALLKWLEGRMASGTPPGAASSALLRRLGKVIWHLEYHRARTGMDFPLTVAGTGGYDFLLSDWGIELFMPDPPAGSTRKQQALDLLRYYSFRQSGRPSLGIPSYMTSALSLLSVDAPTGPSQVEVDPYGLFASLGLSPTCPEAVRLLGRWGVADKTGRHTSQPIRMNFDEYVCAMRPFRCWQVEGAVYRGMAAELPRIVAEAWMPCSRLPELPPNVLGLPSGNSYRHRFANAGDYGLRSLFRERLETQLPDAAHMRFEVQPSPAPVAPTWNPDDVMITNQGFFFPVLPPCPDLGAMLKQIADGRAGNPVFTDSKRPEGPEE